MLYISDTHALFWYFSDDKKLGINAQNIFYEAELGKSQIIVPTIVMAEAIYIAERRKFTFSHKAVFERIKNSSNFFIYPFDNRILERFSTLKEIPEIHDRIISATALVLGLKVITKDPEIKKYIHCIW